MKGIASTCGEWVSALLMLVPFILYVWDYLRCKADDRKN